jgi:hypothetical protein
VNSRKQIADESLHHYQFLTFNYQLILWADSQG